MFVSFIQFIFDLYLDQFGVAGLARRPAGAGGRRLEDESHCVVLSSIFSIFCLPSPELGVSVQMLVPGSERRKYEQF